MLHDVSISISDITCDIIKKIHSRTILALKELNINSEQISSIFIDKDIDYNINSFINDLI